MHQTARVFYFSPTGGVRRVARALGCALAKAPEFFDLSAPDVSMPKADGETPAVFAVPVFAGRVPAPAREAMRRIAGAGAPAVAVAVYGNRAFEDALLELCDLLTARAFVPVAAGAFIAEHSMLRTVAAGRMRATCRRLKLSRRRCRKNWTAAGMRRYLFRAAGRTARANRSRCGHRLRTDA